MTLAAQLYGDLLYRIAFLYLKNTADAQDIVQEVLLRLFEKQPVFASEAQRKAWLITVDRNLCCNVLRSGWRRRVLPLEGAALLAEAPKRERRLLEAVLEMPAHYRDTLYLYYYEGYSTREAAALLGTREATIRTRLHRGREMLKKRLEVDGLE